MNEPWSSIEDVVKHLGVTSGALLGVLISLLFIISSCSIKSCKENEANTFTPQSAPQTELSIQETNDQNEILKIRQLTQQSPFSKFTEQLMKELRTAIAIVPNCYQVPDFPIGASRFGGVPDVPEEFTWPRKDDRLLTFLAQIRLDEVLSFDTENLLPPKGWLLFFYDYKEQPWGADPGDEQASRVIYVDAVLKDLKRTILPEGLTQDLVFPKCALSFSKRFALPSIPDAHWMEEKILTPSNKEFDIIKSRSEFFGERWTSYEKLQQNIFEMNDLQKDKDEFHHLLGYPNYIQFEGINTACNEMASWSKWQMFGNWRLLFQLDSHIVPFYDDNGEKNPRHDAEGKWSWGDAGRLYFAVQLEDLKNKNFDHICVLLQCY